MKRSPSRLRAEIRQTKPFASPAHEAVVSLLKTTDSLHARIALLLDPHQITPQQYNVLRILRGAGEGGLPTLEVAERMIERAPGITRLLDRIEAKGWVRRRRCAEDRRQVLCAITSAGLDLLERLDAPIAAFNEAQVASLSRYETEELVRLLDHVRLDPERLPLNPQQSSARRKKR